MCSQVIIINKSIKEDLGSDIIWRGFLTVYTYTVSDGLNLYYIQFLHAKQNIQNELYVRNFKIRKKYAKYLQG